jgi:hypothetical protein
MMSLNEKEDDPINLKFFKNRPNPNKPPAGPKPTVKKPYPRMNDSLINIGGGSNKESIVEGTPKNVRPMNYAIDASRAEL